MATFAFDATQHTPSYGGAGSLPEGKYKGVIVSDEVKPTKDDTGRFLSLTLQVIEGPLAGQQMVDNLNLWNKSPQASKIANDQLAAYCAVVGVFQFQDSSQLFNKPFQFEVGKQKNNPEYVEVKRIWDINGNDPGKAGAAPAAAAPAAAAPPPSPAAPAPGPAPAPAPAPGPAPAAPAAPAWPTAAPAPAPAAPAWPTAAPAPAPAPAPGGAPPWGAPPQ